MATSAQIKREAKRLFRACFVNDFFDEDRARRAVQQVLSQGRRNRCSVLKYFLRLVRLDRAQHTAQIESATPLSAEMQVVLKNKLLGIYGPGLSTAFIVRPSLIGGTRIQVGSDVYDGSVLARLQALERNF